MNTHTLVNVAIILVTLAIIWYAYFRALPKILQHLASTQTFIAAIPENTWSPITTSGAFSYGAMRLAGHRLTNSGHNGKIENVADTRKKSWFERRGYIWLGFDAPSITRLGSKSITAARLTGKKAGELKHWVEIGPKTISHLRLSFTVYVLVEDIDTTDTHSVSALVMAEVSVLIPYLTWYAQGGQAYGTIRTRIERVVRVEFEKYSLFGLILETDQDTAEANLESGVPNCLDLGVEIPAITMIKWDYKAPPEFIALLESPKAIEARKAGALAQKELEKELADKDVLIAAAKIAAATALKGVSEAEWKVEMAQFGGDKIMARNSILSKKLKPEAFAALQLKEALLGTKVQVLGSDTLTMFNPKPQD